MRDLKGDYLSPVSACPAPASASAPCEGRSCAAVGQVYTVLSVAEYLVVASHGHLSLDSFPFGGCNTVMVRVASAVASVGHFTRTKHLVARTCVRTTACALSVHGRTLAHAPRLSGTLMWSGHDPRRGAHRDPGGGHLA